MMTNDEMMNMMNTMQVMANFMNMMQAASQSPTGTAAPDKKASKPQTPKGSGKSTGTKKTSSSPKGKTKTSSAKKSDDLQYEVLETIAIISESGAWRKKLCLVKWNGAEAVYDLRNWYTNSETGKDEPRKGVTFTKDQLKQLGEVIAKIS